jgi:hypothetical protein
MDRKCKKSKNIQPVTESIWHFIALNTQYAKKLLLFFFHPQCDQSYSNPVPPYRI